MTTENRAELRREILREHNEIMKRLAAEQQELDNDPRWQELQKWVVIDWKEGEEALLQMGATVRDILDKREWSLEVQDHCFIRNFPSLTVKMAHLTDCIFENCGTITIEEGTAVLCTFQKIDTLFLDNVKVYDSVFEELHCDHGGMVISLEDSTISGCHFKDIHLENENYLGDGAGDCLIEKCSFENIHTDREDGELFICEEATGRVFRRLREVNMVDHKSCIGLDSVKNLRA